jgi:hypothetical protein
MFRLARLAWIAMLASGCTDAGTSFFIVQNQVPEPGCVIPSTLTANFLSRGRIEVAADAGYLFTPVVQSQVTDSATGQATRILFVEGADVTLRFQNGLYSESEISALNQNGLSNFRQAFSGSLFPGGTTSFGFEIIPQAMLDGLGGKLGAGETTVVTAEVVMFARLDGGTVEAEPFNYPVEVCDGCLLADRGACAELSPDFVASTGGTCQTLQDFPLDCCTSSEGAQVCPAVPGL